MDNHAVPNRPPAAFDGATGLRLAPPGLLQISRWKHLTEDPVVINKDPSVVDANPALPHA